MGFDSRNCWWRNNGGLPTALSIWSSQGELEAGVFAAPGQSQHPHTTNQNSSCHPWGFPQFSISQIPWLDLGGRKPALVLLKDANLLCHWPGWRTFRGFPLGFQILSWTPLGKRRIHDHLHSYPLLSSPPRRVTNRSVLRWELLIWLQREVGGNAVHKRVTCIHFSFPSGQIGKLT